MMNFVLKMMNLPGGSFERTTSGTLRSRNGALVRETHGETPVIDLIDLTDLIDLIETHGETP